jgi:hypothetical protein
MQSIPKTPTHPLKLLVIDELIRSGWAPKEVQVALGISSPTYYRRVAETRQRRPARPA